MNEIVPNLPASPSQVGNFVIAYEQEIGFITEDISPDDLLRFIQTDVNAEFFCASDAAFFPRAVTDSDLTDNLPVLGKGTKEQTVTNTINAEPTKEDLSKVDLKDSVKMDGHSGDRNERAKNFQPDVIVSNSHHRSGPDGSPALLPSKSQGFLPANLSETGDLFAPVKTLTFSDVDQYSQVDDSCADSSRFVSTPDKAKAGGQYDYDMPAAYRPDNNRENPEVDSDSDSDHIHNEPREKTPEFRQLEGEPDVDLISTGAFQPSAHGLNQEFMDNFTGRTRNMYSMGSVFSPLSRSGNQLQGRFEVKTPPLHVPATNSPLVKHSGYKATTVQQEYQEEIQFQMSPTRNIPGSVKDKKSPMLVNRQEYMNSDRLYQYSYPNEHTFEPIDKLPQNLMAQSTVPKNLDEYNGDNYKAHTSEMKSKAHHPKQDQRDVDRAVNRQGDGYDHDMQQGLVNMMRMPDEVNQQFAAVSPAAFEQRYLQRTQVSVKLPQPTYDTMTSNYSYEERRDTADQPQTRFEPPGLPPDSLQKEINTKTSPEKAVDYLATQTSSHYKQDSAIHGQSDDQATNKANSEQQHATKVAPSQSLNVSGDDKQFKSSGQNNTKFGDVIAESATASSSAIVTNKTQLGQPGASKPTGQLQTKNGKQTGTQPSQQLAQAQPPSSRLMQETISQKSKMNHKFVPGNPGLSKSIPCQNKDNAKQQEVARKNSNTNSNTTSAGARRTIMSESEKNTAVKSKSASMESLNQKQRPSQGHNTGRYGNKSDQNSTAQARDGQLKRDLGHRLGDQGHGKGQGRGSPGLDHHGDNNVVTQVQSTSPVTIEATVQSARGSQHVGETSLDVKGMEDVRHQLQSMLRLSHDTMSPQERSQYEHSEIVAGFGMEMGEQARGMDNSWNMTRKPHDDEVSELFPSFSSSSQYLVDSGNVSRSDASVHMENQRLRDMVDKERYRRKHCEQYIQQLNVKLLETQQQVAVAVSTDKRKDIMIEQLDKQLAVVMEGWKKRDMDKEAMMDDIRKEKEEVEARLQQQQQMINNFEHDMSQAVDALREEKEKASQALEEMKEKLEVTERSRSHDKEMLAAEREKLELHQQECDSLREARDTLDKKLDNMQRRLHREQDDWFQREQELLQRIEEVSEKNTKILQIERTKNEEQGKLAEEVMDQYQAAATRAKQLEMELDAAMREKESVKVEMGIMEAKFENAQRVLEAEMHATMEKQIADQITDVQARTEKTIEELQEKHRAQVVDMNQQHGRELEKQLAVFREEVTKKEDNFRQQLNELESRLTEYRTENSELKLSKQKLESTRLEILTKLQYAMQTQWNEAFSLLSSTPQRKGPVPNLQIEASADGVEVQSLPSVSFSYATSSNQNSQHTALTNHGTPPRSTANLIQERPSSNHSTPDRRRNSQSSIDRQKSANEMSSERKVASQHSSDRTVANRHSPDRKGNFNDNFQAGSAGDIASGDDSDPQSIETTTLLHMQQFQDYMNRVAQTPEWISTINMQPSPRPDIPDRPPPTLPQPPDLAALLASHLHNMQHQQHHQHHQQQQQQQQQHHQQQQQQQQHQQQQQQLQTSLSSNPSQARRAQKPSSGSQNSSASIGSDPHPKTLNLSSASNGNSQVQALTPPKVTSLVSRSANQSAVSQSHGGISQSHKEDMSHGWSLNPGGRGISFGDAHDLSCAVPIRPPQQGEDPYLHDDDQSVISSIMGSQAGYFQGGQSFSPPTKQSRIGHDDSLEEDFTQSQSRLNEDYNHLTEKMEQHESHQNELQHYIQMLLNKPPSENGHDDSLFSQEELDLNDTAQAAQLQRELDRIQQLRQKQEMSAKTSADSHPDVKPNHANAEAGVESAKILNPEQLSEISRLLSQVKQQSDPNSSHVVELLDLLKHAQMAQGQAPDLEQSRAPRGRPGAAPTGVRDRNKGLPGAKRNVQFNPAKGVEGPRPAVDAQKSQSDKQPAKAAQSGKKVERKIAGSASKGDKGPKPAAWK